MKQGLVEITTTGLISDFDYAILITREEVERVNELVKVSTFYTKDDCILYINKIQQDATLCRYLFTAKSLSTCFGCPTHPSSGEHKTVTAASGTGHSI